MSEDERNICPLCGSEMIPVGIKKGLAEWDKTISWDGTNSWDGYFCPKCNPELVKND